MSNDRISKAKNGNCACAEGYIGIWDEGSESATPDYFEPTGLYVHDCRYIKLRNSKLREAERLSNALGMPFLKAMDALMAHADRNANLVAFEMIKEQGVVNGS